MKWIKPMVGCVLIAAAFLGLIYWENEGRSHFMMEEVAVAADDIAEGALVNYSMFKRMQIPKDNLLSGALIMEQLSELKGMISDRPITANSQITADFFDTADSRIEKGKSIFVIKPSWIDARSSSLRAGDTVHIYSDTGDSYFGAYRLAFVKDDNEQEVVAADGFTEPGNILARKMSSRAVHHIEIIATLAEYEAIMTFVTQEKRGLLIVQKGDF